MLAVIRTGGKQYVVRKGSTIDIELISTTEGEKVTFDDVLLVADEKQSMVGAPKVANATVTGTVKLIGKGPKVRSIRYKPKKRQRTVRGHRQQFVRVVVDAISAK